MAFLASACQQVLLAYRAYVRPQNNTLLYDFSGLTRLYEDQEDVGSFVMIFCHEMLAFMKSDKIFDLPGSFLVICFSFHSSLRVSFQISIPHIGTQRIKSGIFLFFFLIECQS